MKSTGPAAAAARKRMSARARSDVRSKGGVWRGRSRGRPCAPVVLLGLLGCAIACGGARGGAGDAGGGGASVVLIVIDAARADHLGLYGYSRPTSPEIDARAAAGRVYEHAYTTAPWTLPAFGSILTGRLPSGHGAGIEVTDEEGAAHAEEAAARRFVTLRPEVSTVAELLGDSGFTTGAFVTNPFLHPRFGLGRGFADYDHFESSNSEVRRADVVADLALEWIGAHAGRPFFLMVHFFDPHLDYDAPPPFRGRFATDEGGLQHPVQGLWPLRNRVAEMSAAERDFITAAYDEEIAFVDAQVGRFLAGLREDGLSERTLVILTADHGEELFDHGGFEHGHSVYDEVARVPLIVWGPGVEPGREPAPVSLIDIAPTILAAAGVPAPEALAGVSLLDAGTPREGAAPRQIVVERLLYGAERKAIVEWPYKAMLDTGDGEARLFDLAADPGERDDLAAVRAQELRGLLGDLADRLAAARAAGGTGVAAEIDPELMRRLRALGYIH